MRRIETIILSILFWSLLLEVTQAQTNDIQYGVALKATIDINGIESNGKYSNFNLSLFGGLGGHPFDVTGVFPTVHAGVVLYNRGDLISSYNKGFLESTVLDFMVDVTMNFGIYSPSTPFQNKRVPLFHFSDFTSNPLENPFRHSFSVGSNFIWSTQENRKHQRVGFTGLMIDRIFQINTYNDGSIWGRLYLGDKHDRYYTGGGVLGLYLDNSYLFDNLEFSFHKFTWYEESTFQVGEILQLDFIPYKSEETKFYNKGRLRFTFKNTQRNYGVHLTFHNTDKDFQDGIHFGQNSPYHPDIFTNRGGIKNELKRIGIGGFLFTNYHKFTN